MLSEGGGLLGVLKFLSPLEGASMKLVENERKRESDFDRFF